MKLKQHFSKISWKRVAIAASMGLTILSFQNMVSVSKPAAIKFSQLPSGRSHQSTEKIIFSSENSLLEIRETLCQLDNETPFRCSGTVVLTDLKPGVHNFSVRTRDGNDNESSAAYQWTFDPQNLRR